MKARQVILLRKQLLLVLFARLHAFEGGGESVSVSQGRRWRTSEPCRCEI